MGDYNDEVRYAIATLVPSLWHESDEEATLHAEFHRHERATEAGYRQSEAIALDAEDADAVGLAIAIHWDTYFGVDKGAPRDCCGAPRSSARAAPCTAPFPGHLGGEPAAGREAGAVGGTQRPGFSASWSPVWQQGLATVVWQARNQSMHREAGTLRAPVTACFDTLKADFGAQYASPTTRNLAFQVVQVLAWRTADDVLADLALLT